MNAARVLASRSLSISSFSPLACISALAGRHRFQHPLRYSSRNPLAMTGAENAAKKETPPFDPAPSFYITENIDPEWTYGAGIRKSSVLASEWNEEEKQGWKSFNLEEMSKP